MCAPVLILSMEKSAVEKFKPFGSDNNSGCDVRKTTIYITGFNVFMHSVTQEKTKATAKRDRNLCCFVQNLKHAQCNA